MGRFTSAVVSGLIFGAVAVALMLPMRFPEKRAALLGPFASRSAIGFTIDCVQLPWAGDLTRSHGMGLDVPPGSPEDKMR